MKQLSKKQQKQLAELVEELREREQAVNDAFDVLDSAAADYNASTQEVTAFINGVYSDIESHYNGRSERWQESEAGEAYHEWLLAWESAAPEEVEVDRPTFYGSADELDELPVEPDFS